MVRIFLIHKETFYLLIFQFFLDEEAKERQRKRKEQQEEAKRKRQEEKLRKQQEAAERKIQAEREREAKKLAKQQEREAKKLAKLQQQAVKVKKFDFLILINNFLIFFYSFRHNNNINNIEI